MVPVGLSKRPMPPFCSNLYSACMKSCWMVYGSYGKAGNSCLVSPAAPSTVSSRQLSFAKIICIASTVVNELK